MGTTVKFGEKPKGFRLMPEGERTLKITKAVGKPRANVKLIEAEFVDAEGIVLKNNYKLDVDGGYAAFYWLVNNGLDIDLEAGDKFDIDDLVGKYIVVEIVHREGNQPRQDGTVPVFHNIAKTLSPGEPFDEYGEPQDEGDGDEGDWG